MPSSTYAGTGKGVIALNTKFANNFKILPLPSSKGWIVINWTKTKAARLYSAGVLWTVSQSAARSDSKAVYSSKAVLKLEGIK